MANNEKVSRYKAVAEGIRKDLKTGNYEAYKKVNGKRYAKSFPTLLEARNWKGSFIPTEEKIREKRLKFKR